MVFAYLNASNWLMYVCISGILFCWLIEITAAFRHNAPSLAICSIVLTPLAGLIIGCVHARQWRIVQVMIVFVGCILSLFVVMLYEMIAAAETISATTRLSSAAF